MKKIFLILTAVSTGTFAVSLALYFIFKSSFLETAAITLGTFCYHFLMRLAVGLAVNAAMKNRADPQRFPYTTFPFERKLYKALKVRKWSKNIRSYDPSLFSSSLHTHKEIAGAMCQAETVHMIIVILSFIPLFAAIPFGAFFAFLATSVAAALYDLRFVIAQRYNRPRIVRLINSSKS